MQKFQNILKRLVKVHINVPYVGKQLSRAHISGLISKLIWKDFNFPAKIVERFSGQDHVLEVINL